MLRSIVTRNEILKETFKKAVRINTTRTLSVECVRRRHRHNNPSLLKSTNKLQWKYNLVRFYADYPSHIKVVLPALSPTMETGTLVSWGKKEGEKLSEGDVLAEIETDKATMSFETPEEGYLAKIIVPSGTKGVPIGQLVCIIVQNEGDVAAFKDFKDTGGPPAAAAAPPMPAAPPPPTAAPPMPAPPSVPSTPPATAAPGGRVYASPMAKRLADQRQIRLQGKGTGLYDSITSRDLPAPGAAPAAAAGAPAPKAGFPAAAAPTSPYIDIPMSGMRETIAKRLTLSKTTIPHYYLTAVVNIDKLQATRTRLNKATAKDGVKISVNDFVVKAMAMACKKVPEVNSIWMGTAIRQFQNVDVSVAVSTDSGLITPIVFNADAKGLGTISKNVKELAAKARSNRLKPQEYQGGTITISNLGMYSIDEFSAVINPPQAAILAVGTANKKLVLDEKAEKGFKEVTTMTVTLSCDHRIVDGAVGAVWIEAFRKFIENPELLLL